jgi:putative FmdB family regulatory protein
MPLKQFTCPACGSFTKLMNRADYDATHTTACPECGVQSPSTISAPARRNPAHGIQR